MHELAYVLESFTVETFSEIISPLFFRVNLQNTDVSVGDMTPEEVPFDKKVLRSVGDSLLGCKKKSAVVVFEDATSNCRFELGWKTKCRDDFSEKGSSEWQKRPHARAEGGVFRFKS